MIVLDASAAVEWLLRTSRGHAVERRITTRNEVLHAPHLLDIEVAQALRKLSLAGDVSRPRATAAMEDFSLLRVRRYPHAPLLDRIWQLRANLTAYDAAYVALAEWLSAPLLTGDSRLASAPGHSAQIELI